jgi:hypothetical protein
MPRIRLGGLTSVVAIWLVFAAVEMARANSVETLENGAAASSVHGCDADPSPCRSKAHTPASTHLRSLFAHHGQTKTHVRDVAAHRETDPLLVTEVYPSLSSSPPAGSSPVCTGIFAWSLLCPGSQLIGISY